MSGVHVSLESLLKDKELTSIINDVIRGCGRSIPTPTHMEEREEEEVSGIQQIASLVTKTRFSSESNGNGIPRKEALAVVS